MTTYKEAASSGYEVLTGQYRQDGIFDGNFWFGGNALHTCLTYLLSAKESDSGGILEYAYNNVYLPLDGPGWWRDDYGWWGNAFCFAIKFRKELGYESAENDQLFANLLNAAENCWKMLNSNWSDSAYNKTTDNAAGSSAITGGTSNTFNSPPMSGRNSVTNEGFWILSQQLEKLVPSNDDYKKRAADEAAWFSRWLAQSGSLRNQLGLILERPMGNGTDPQWYWAGDQGLFIAGNLNISDQANAIAQAVIKNMTDVESVLHENMGFYDHQTLKQFLGDYATGKGILIRNISFLNYNQGANNYSSFIMRNAAAVWCNRIAGNQFTFNWNPKFTQYEPEILESKGENLDYLIMQAAGQEALNAALWISPDKDVMCLPEE